MRLGRCNIDTKNLIVFVMGFMARHLMSSGPNSEAGCHADIIASQTAGSESNGNLKGSDYGDVAAPSSSSSHDVVCPSMHNNGIYPLMRDFQCGHANMETPRALRKTAGAGRGRYVVDVGLFDGEETLDAVEAGFVVFGFEMMKGGMAKIRANAEKRGIIDRVHFVDFVYDKVRKIPVAKNLPRPPKDGKGYAYIFNAGLSDEVGSIDDKSGHDNVFATLNSNTISKGWSKWSKGKVPILRLDQTLPEWVEHIFFLKIDTQGFEMKVLNGAEKYLRFNKVQYAQYEFSPKLMRSARSGDPIQLLKFMVSLGAVCFDMMMEDTHHLITRPSTPLERYYESINSGRNSTHRSAYNNYTQDSIGPWDDILCWFPEATS